MYTYIDIKRRKFVLIFQFLIYIFRHVAQKFIYCFIRRCFINEIDEIIDDADYYP